MAATNRDLVGNAMDTLKSGLAPFVSREFTNHYGQQSAHKLQEILDGPIHDVKNFSDMDVAALLKVMWVSWNDVYRDTLGHAERSLVSELRHTRNLWAHQKAFSGDDVHRALDSAHRLLLAVSAEESGKVDEMKKNLWRRLYDDYMRAKRGKIAGTPVEGPATGNLTPWRDVVTPHDDVASGQYQQAEFAADLWQVHIGEGSAEYRDPAEFFRRTYLTDSLKRLLGGAVRRLAGKGGDPVVQIQTNFGGGKTHSMLALYHLFSGTPINELSGMDEIVNDESCLVLGKPGGSGRQQNIAGEPGHKAGRHYSANPVGGACMAAGVWSRRRGGSPPGLRKNTRRR